MNSYFLIIQKGVDGLTVMSIIFDQADELAIIILAELAQPAQPVQPVQPVEPPIKKQKGKNEGTPCFDALKTWLKNHISNPYPSKEQINDFVLTNDLTETQVKDWFANARRRWPVFKKYNRVKKINRSRMMF